MYKYTDFLKLNHYFLYSVVGCKFILRVSYSYKLFQKLDNPFREHLGLDTITCSEMPQSNTSRVTSSSDDNGRYEIDINQVVNSRVSQLLKMTRMIYQARKTPKRKSLIPRKN